jgi:hypothetical protein
MRLLKGVGRERFLMIIVSKTTPFCHPEPDPELASGSKRFQGLIDAEPSSA